MDQPKFKEGDTILLYDGRVGIISDYIIWDDDLTNWVYNIDYGYNLNNNDKIYEKDIKQKLF